MIYFSVYFLAGYSLLAFAYVAHFLWRWVAKLVAHLLDTAALLIRIQTYVTVK